MRVRVVLDDERPQGSAVGILARVDHRREETRITLEVGGEHAGGRLVIRNAQAATVVDAG
ncbi:hypothetical protein [Cellulosimicrobium funkei]|uniref:hypothetical protein n=1 Tax=Cellulosimicrobium funkei TaxID=264251 RepID=UPI003427BE7F